MCFFFFKQKTAYELRISDWSSDLCSSDLRALWAVIMTAYITGTSTRKVDDLVRALGCDSGVSKSTVSRICSGIDDEITAFRTRRLDHMAMPYVYLDATYIKARHDHRIVSRAVIVATAVTPDEIGRAHV